MLRNHEVRAFDGAHKGDTILKRNHCAFAFILDKLVHRYTNDQLIAHALGILQQVEVSNVKEVIDPCCVSYYHNSFVI